MQRVGVVVCVDAQAVDLPGTTLDNNVGAIAGACEDTVQQSVTVAVVQIEAYLRAVLSGRILVDLFFLGTTPSRQQP